MWDLTEITLLTTFGSVSLLTFHVKICISTYILMYLLSDLENFKFLVKTLTLSLVKYMIQASAAFCHHYF